MTLSNLTEDHGATCVAVMYPSADKSCLQAASELRWSRRESAIPT